LEIVENYRNFRRKFAQKINHFYYFEKEFLFAIQHTDIVFITTKQKGNKFSIPVSVATSWPKWRIA